MFHCDSGVRLTFTEILLMIVSIIATCLFMTLVIAFWLLFWASIGFKRFLRQQQRPEKEWPRQDTSL